MRVAIVGAGPGGLTLARVLHVHGIQAEVYERDAGRDARPQGGSLDLHADRGQWALAEAALTAEFERFARVEGQDLRLFDEHGVLLLDDHTPPDAPLARPEIDRADLRDLLLDSLPAATVRWGRPYPAVPDADLLVGADGAWSRVRSLVSDVRPVPLGKNVLEGTITEPPPEVDAAVGRGNYWAIGPCRSLAAQRLRDGAIRVGLSWQGDGGPELFADWAPQHRAVIDAVPQFTRRELSVLPVGFGWEHRPGVTLIGDAAHLMPPVGFGANLAMQDGAELALTLVRDGVGGVRAYEAAMLARSARVARMSAEIEERMTSPRGAEAVLEFFAA